MPSTTPKRHRFAGITVAGILGLCLLAAIAMANLTADKNKPASQNATTVAPAGPSTDQSAERSQPRALTVAPETSTPEQPTDEATVAVASVTPVPPQPTVALPAGPVAARNANLRQGPGTNYAISGGVSSGQALEIVARNDAGDWLQLASGAWIAASLVRNVPDVPVAASIPAPPAPSAVPSAVVRSGGETPPAFTCVGGCATPPDPSCAIKGNVNSKGERIYHTPGQRDYERTDIKPEEGDRWFCTEDEAIAAGFRHAQR